MMLMIAIGEFARLALEVQFDRAVIVFLLLTNVLSVAIAFSLVQWERQGRMRDRIARRLGSWRGA